jgi:hypothetical protein
MRRIASTTTYLPKTTMTQDNEKRLRTIRQAFADSDVTRRDYLRASAGVGTALALPTTTLSGTAIAQTADSSGITVPKQYQFVANHTPSDETVPTLIEFRDADGFSELDALDAEPRTTTDPSPAAYVNLSPEQVEQILNSEEKALPSATRLSYSPGANPFWRLDGYPNRVFPAPADSKDFVAYEEAMSGLEHLQEQHPEMLSLTDIGSSPGWYNLMTFEVEPQEIRIATVTNGVGDEASLKEKEKVLYSVSLHGDERAGVETSVRLIEDIVNGHNETFASLLDDIALVFLYANPDGWIAKSPVYFSGDKVTDTDLVRINTFRRLTGTLRDPNRQWPTVGYINPLYYPAEPNGANLTDDDPGIDEDIPVQYEKYVPGTLDMVEYFRGYDNLNYAIDVQGMFDEERFVLGLIMNTEYDFEELHQVNELASRCGENLTESIGPLLEENADAYEQWVAELEEQDEDYEATVPTEAFDYGTIFDTISYTTTGTLGSWYATPEDLGGLGLITLSPEIALNNRVIENMDYYTGVIETQIAAVETIFETTAKQATRQVTAAVNTGGARTAYVTTDSVRRSSKSLAFSDTSVDTNRESVTVPADRSESVTVTVDEGTTLHVRLSGNDSRLTSAVLHNPEGERTRRYDPSGTRAPHGTAWTVQNATGGEWTVEIENEYRTEAATVTVTIGTVLYDGEGSPDPTEALGYQQRSYEVTPFAFFEEYATYTDKSNALTAVSAKDVQNGALFESDSDTPAFENVVVIHDDNATNDAYVNAFEEYVAAGGNLILTDTGVRHLGTLGGPAETIDDGDVSQETFVVPYLEEKNLDDPLLDDVREIQRELWKVAPLGYSIGDAAPMTLVETDAFEESEGTIASTTDNLVSAGTLEDNESGSVEVIASLLRPATQANLHPFGLHDYAISFLGQTMLTNALGYESERQTTGEVRETDDADDIYQGPGDDDDGDNVDADGDGAVDEDDEDKDDDDDNDGNNRDDDGDGAIDEDDDRK